MSSAKDQTLEMSIDHDDPVFENALSVGPGPVVNACQRCLSGPMDPLLAEAFSFREAVGWFKGKGILNVVFESNCLGLVQLLRSSVVDISYFGLVVLLSVLK